MGPSGVAEETVPVAAGPAVSWLEKADPVVDEARAAARTGVDRRGRELVIFMANDCESCNASRPTSPTKVNNRLNNVETAAGNLLEAIRPERTQL